MDLMKLLFGIAVAGVLLALLAWAGSKRRRKMIAAAFAGREQLTDEQFFEAHFRSRGVRENVSSEVRRILAKQFGEDMSRLAAGDDVTKNLKFFFDSDSLVDVEIILALEEAFDIKIADEEAQAMHTVEDLVLGVHNKLRLRNDA